MYLNNLWFSLQQTSQAGERGAPNQDTRRGCEEMLGGMIPGWQSRVNDASMGMLSGVPVGKPRPQPSPGLHVFGMGDEGRPHSCSCRSQPPLAGTKRQLGSREVYSPQLKKNSQMGECYFPNPMDCMSPISDMNVHRMSKE